MSNKLQIFNSDGTAFYDIVLESYTYSHTTMSLDASIDGSFVSNLDLRDKFKHTEYVLYKDIKYYLIADVTSTRDSAFSNKDKGLFRYTVKFNAPMIELTRMFMYDPQTGQRSYAFYGDVKRLTDDIEYNLVGNWRLVYQPNFTPSTDVPDEPISFDGATVADALNKLYSEKNVPFTVEGYTIYIGTPVTEVGHTFKYSKEGGLKTEPTTPKNNSICTQVYPIGSTQNIPYPYPKIYDSEGEYARVYKRRKADGSLTSVSVFKTHLMPSIYRETLQAHVDNGYDADNYPVMDYYTADDTYVNPFNPELPLPLEVTNEDIRPTIEGATYKGEPIDVLAGVSYYENDNDVINLETGEVEVPMFKITLPPMGFDVYAQAAVTGAMTIAMKSGDTIGASYKIQVSEEEFNKNFYKTFDDLGTAIEAIDLEIQKKNDYIDAKIANNSAIVLLVGDAQEAIDLAEQSVEQSKTDLERIDEEIIISGETPERLEILYQSLDNYSLAKQSLQEKEDYLQSLHTEYFTQADIDVVNEEISLLQTQKTQLEANYEVSDFPRGGAIFDPTNRDYELFPDSTNQSITIDVLKDIDTFGVLVPQEYRRPSAGDKFVLLNIEMPLSYVTQAEGRLSEYGKEWMRENNEYLREHPIKFDEALFHHNPTIANQITTNALIPYEIGGVLRKMPIQKITIKYYDEAIPTYDLILTDEIVVSQNAVASNTQKLQEQAYEVKQNEIKNADRVRHNSYLTQKTLDGLFDAEGGNRIDNVEANVGYFNGLFVGQNPNDFGLSDVSQSLGATSAQFSGGTLTHYWGDAPFENKVWIIAPSDIIQLDDTKQYYLYIQANRTNNSAVWVISPNQKLYNEDSNVWFFNAGQIIYYGEFWSFVRTYGITTTIGATISSEILKSHNFELTNDKFIGMMIDLMNSRIYMGDGAEIVTRSLTIRPDGGEDIDAYGAITNAQNSADSAIEKIDNTQVGTINLLRGTSDEWLVTSTPVSSTNVYLIVNHNLSDYGLEVGDNLTFFAQIQNGGGSGARAIIMYVNEAGSILSVLGGSLQTNGQTSVVTVVPVGAVKFRVAISTLEVNTPFEYKEAMLVKGNRTDVNWDRSPLDSQSVVYIYKKSEDAPSVPTTTVVADVADGWSVEPLSLTATDGLVMKIWVSSGTIQGNSGAVGGWSAPQDTGSALTPRMTVNGLIKADAIDVENLTAQKVRTVKYINDDPEQGVESETIIEGGKLTTVNAEMRNATVSGTLDGVEGSFTSLTIEGHQDWGISSNDLGLVFDGIIQMRGGVNSGVVANNIFAQQGFSFASRPYIEVDGDVAYYYLAQESRIDKPLLRYTLPLLNGTNILRVPLFLPEQAEYYYNYPAHSIFFNVVIVKGASPSYRYTLDGEQGYRVRECELFNFADTSFILVRRNANMTIQDRWYHKFISMNHYLDDNALNIGAGWLVIDAKLLT